jgi:hypothetical protein
MLLIYTTSDPLIKDNSLFRYIKYLMNLKNELSVIKGQEVVNAKKFCIQFTN